MGCFLQPYLCLCMSYCCPYLCFCIGICCSYFCLWVGCCCPYLCLCLSCCLHLYLCLCIGCCCSYLFLCIGCCCCCCPYLCLCMGCCCRLYMTGSYWSLAVTFEMVEGGEGRECIVVWHYEILGDDRNLHWLIAHAERDSKKTIRIQSCT